MTSNTVSIATVLLLMLLERFSFWFVVVVKCEIFSLQLYFLFIVVVVEEALNLGRYYIAKRRKTANSFLIKCNVFLTLL